MGNRAVVTFANMADVEAHLVKDDNEFTERRTGRSRCRRHGEGAGSNAEGDKVMKWYDWLLGVIGTVAWFALASYVHSL